MVITSAMTALLMASNVTLHIEVIEGLREEQITRVMIQMKQSFENALGAGVVLDAVRGPRCDDRPRCLEEIRSRNKTEELLLVRLIAAVTRTGLYVERCDATGASIGRENAFLAFDDKSWDATFTELAGKLYPEGVPKKAAPAVVLTPPKIEPPPEPPPELVETAELRRARLDAEAARLELFDARTTLGNWLLGSGLGAAVLGAAGLVIARVASLDAANNATTPEELVSATNTGRGLEIGGTALAGSGAALFAAALVVYSTRPE